MPAPIDAPGLLVSEGAERPSFLNIVEENLGDHNSINCLKKQDPLLPVCKKEGRRVFPVRLEQEIIFKGEICCSV